MKSHSSDRLFKAKNDTSFEFCIAAPLSVARCPGLHFQKKKGGGGEGTVFPLKMARTEEMALLNAVVQWLQHAHKEG